MHNRSLPMALMAGGLAMILVSFLVPGVLPAGWSDEDQSRYEAASERYHAVAAGHTHGEAAEGPEIGDGRALAEAREAFEYERRRLDAAQQRAPTVAWWLRAVGVVAAAGGAVIHYVRLFLDPDGGT